MRPPAAWSPQHAGGSAEEAAFGPGGPSHQFRLSSRSRASTVVIALAVVVCTLAVAGVMAAVALPVFLHQRVQTSWEKTTVALPATFDGVPRGDVPEFLRTSGAVEGWGKLEAGSYVTSAGATAYVLAGKSPAPMNETDQLEGRREFVAGLASGGVGITLEESDAGPLGGFFGCGKPESPALRAATICLATDHAALVMVVLRGSKDAVGDARRLREEIVHR